MESTKPEWYSSVSIRICHPNLDPSELSMLLNATPEIAQKPGESRVPYGDCRSAGYWCLQHRIDAPDRPDIAISWAEEFIEIRKPAFRQFTTEKYYVDVYVAVFSNVLALGFNMPPTPTITELGIHLGFEFFSA
ncbi:MAG: hypothetical protein V4719_08645 [Planctomycetota bacterium]